MKRLFFTITTLITFISFGQAPDIEWGRSYGGSDIDIAHSIQQTTDGGYIVAGSSSSNNGDVIDNYGSADYWVVKLDATGNITWKKSLGGSGYESAYSIQETMDGGYIIAGSSESSDGDVGGNHGGLDYWIVKLNTVGNIIWEKNLGGSNEDYAWSIQQTIDGGYIVAGSSESNDGDVGENHGGADYWIVKLDAIGNITWEKNFGGSHALSESAQSIQQTMDGGYIVAGYSISNDGDVGGNHGGFDYWIVKLDAVGNITWEKNLGGSAIDQAYSIQQTTDGGYIVAGVSRSNDVDVSENQGGYDYWILKLNTIGDITWEKNLGGTNDDTADSIQQTMDGGYIVVGWSNSNDGDVSGNHGARDYWIVKLNAVGIITWEKNIGGSSSEWARSIQQTMDGGYIIAGRSASNDGDVSGNHGGFDYWIVKLAPDNTAGVAELDKKQLTIYPNPVKDNLTIAVQNTPIQSISIVDVTGKLVKRFTENTNTINVGELVNGVYFMTVNTEKGVYQSKFVKE